MGLPGRKVTKKRVISAYEMEVRAIDLLESGKVRRAERILKRLLERDPTSVGAHFNLVRIYLRTGQDELALYHGRRVLRLNPQEKNVCLNMGMVYESMGRHQLAISYYKRELSRNPGSPETLYYLGHLYYERHRWRAASKYLRQCFEIGYAFEMEQTVYKLSCCYDELRDIRSFIDVLTQYVAINPKAAWAFSNLGCALLAAKDYKGAALRLARAIELGTKNSVAAELARAKEMIRKQKAGRT